MVLLTIIRMLLALAFLGCGVSVKESSWPAKLDLSLGYSYVQLASSATNGLGSESRHRAEMSVSYQLEPWLRVVADFGLGRAGNRSSDIVGTSPRRAAFTYLLGPRLILPLGRATPFAQFLLGAAHANAGMFDGSTKQTDFAWALVGGFDYQLTPHFALRPLQLEFLRSNFFELQDDKLTRNVFRVSTGIVLRF
jgi:hypothetical protein